MASFPYEKSSIFNDFFLGWAFSPIKYYHSHNPSPSNLFEIPENLKIQKDLKKVAVDWNEESQQKNPSFLKVILKSVY